jgi:uncharacterized protein YbjT (DUF2867 family)
MSTTGKILVTGATSNYGSAMIQNLIAIGADIRALVHDESKAQGLRAAGVEVAVGDYLWPETLDAAFEGVDKVFLHTPLSPDAAKMASNCIAAARRAGQPHIVRLAEKSPEPVNALRIGVLHAEFNAELEASGLPYTSLRPTFYMQNTLAAAQSVASDGMIYMPFKDAKLGMIDMRDVAETAAKILTTEGDEGQIYVLTGPAAISFHDVVSVLSKVLGKEVKYVNVPLKAAQEAMIGLGMREWLAEAFCEYFENHSKGVSDFTTNDVEKLTGHPPRSFETFARDFAQYFRQPL